MAGGETAITAGNPALWSYVLDVLMVIAVCPRA